MILHVFVYLGNMCPFIVYFYEFILTFIFIHFISVNKYLFVMLVLVCFNEFCLLLPVFTPNASFCMLSILRNVHV